MATIELYAHKVNQMPGLVRDVRKSVWDYKMELSLLEDVALRIDQDICNVEDVVRSIRASAQVQEEKAASLEALHQEVEEFIEEVVRIDREVADAIRRRKEEFYELHPYLKPADEKSDWERFWDRCGEWCREHWKAVVTGVLVIAAVALACTGVGGPLGAILLGACKGLLVGVAIGGVLGGLSSVAAGRPFLEGFEDGALSGALIGAFFGGLSGLGWVLGSSGKVVGALGPAARAIPAVFGTSTVVALGMFGFDLLALGISLFSMDHPLVQWNKKLHENGLYNAFQFTVSALAAFSGGFRKGMAGWKKAESGSKTNFDNEIPRSGSEWNEYLKGKYGADNVHWNINSVDDIFSDPTRLKGYTVDELQKVLGNDWTRGVYGSNGGGWKLTNGDISIFYHPGGGKHGGSYYGISSGATGKIKVVNPETYIPLKGDKATIIYD